MSNSRLPTGDTTNWYSFAGDAVAFRDGTGLRFMVGDHQGSTSTVYTPSTGDVARQRYFPFGGIRDTDGQVGTDLGYTGQRLDQATGLMFYQSRYYDPLAGRFAQPDTIVPDPADPQALNRYTYVRNNPVSLTDPTGHAWAIEGGGRTIKPRYVSGANDRAAANRSRRNIKTLYRPVTRTYRSGSNDRIASRGKKAAAVVYRKRPLRSTSDRLREEAINAALAAAALAAAALERKRRAETLLAQSLGNYLRYEANRHWHAARAFINIGPSTGAWIYSEARGGDCGMRASAIVECVNVGRASYSQSNTFQIGNATITSRGRISDSVGRHEEKHADQWAIVPLFPLVYGLEPLRVGGRRERNIFERWAGLADGDYTD